MRFGLKYHGIRRYRKEEAGGVLEESAVWRETCGYSGPTRSARRHSRSEEGAVRNRLSREAGSNCGRALADKSLHCFQEQPWRLGNDGIRFSVLENQSAGMAERKK